ncbi:unnamed protein product [Pedinophyceae sp. YPF-701]|nr:unnamed protein product [Pedinophyceae sp. YPF-701]
MPRKQRAAEAKAAVQRSGDSDASFHSVPHSQQSTGSRPISIDQDQGAVLAAAVASARDDPATVSYVKPLLDGFAPGSPAEAIREAAREFTRQTMIAVRSGPPGPPAPAVAALQSTQLYELIARWADHKDFGHDRCPISEAIYTWARSTVPALRLLAIQVSPILVGVYLVRQKAATLALHPLPGLEAALIALYELSSERRPVPDVLAPVGDGTRMDPQAVAASMTAACPPHTRVLLGRSAEDEGHMPKTLRGVRGWQREPLAAAVLRLFAANLGLIEAVGPLADSCRRIRLIVSMGCTWDESEDAGKPQTLNYASSFAHRRRGSRSASFDQDQLMDALSGGMSSKPPLPLPPVLVSAMCEVLGHLALRLAPSPPGFELGSYELVKDTHLSDSEVATLRGELSAAVDAVLMRATADVDPQQMVMALALATLTRALSQEHVVPEGRAA